MKESDFHFNLTAGLTASMLIAFFILTFTNIRAPYGRYGTAMVRPYTLSDLPNDNQTQLRTCNSLVRSIQDWLG